MTNVRHDWTLEEVSEIYNRPLMQLIHEAAEVHRKNHNSGEVQVCTLLSVKTGGCSEDCKYCPQSARNESGVKAEKLLSVEEVVERAQRAKKSGSTRFCMGAAWRSVKNGEDFDQVLDMVGQVNDLGLEVCATLGMISLSQAEKLKQAGLTAYNHNLDTGPDFYKEVISTRTYEDRLETLDKVGKAKLSLCCGGIIGMGESEEDRIGLLHTLATLPIHPESVPVNALVPVEGTPLEEQPRVSIWEMLRMIATARILIPTAKVRLSAGRQEMSVVEQALCFSAGANSIFSGEKLLTTPNAPVDQDHEMFDLLGLKPMQAFVEKADGPVLENA